MAKSLDLFEAIVRVAIGFSDASEQGQPDEVKEAVEGLVRRAVGFGAHRAEDYVFPFGGGSRRGDLDVSLPMTKFGLKATWNHIRDYAGFNWLRPYDMRHTAITRMAENGVPIAVIMSFSGHIKPQMQQHYITISMQAKREAAFEAWQKFPPSSVKLLPQHAVA